MAFCTNCGAKIKGDTKFCPNCGASVEGTPQTPKGSSAPGPAPQGAAGSAAQGKALAMLKRNYKLIGIAVLAVWFCCCSFPGAQAGKETMLWLSFRATGTGRGSLTAMSP